jgi:hypothetical protein
VSSLSSFQICQITQDKAAHPLLKQHKSALETAHEAALNHKQLERYHDDLVLARWNQYRVDVTRPHVTASMAHAQIREKLQHIKAYHQKRIDEINKGHASVDHDEAKKIEASTTFSAEALRCAVDMDPRAPETRTAVKRLSAHAAKSHLFDPPSKNNVT